MNLADPTPALASKSVLEQFARDGFVVLRQVLKPERAASLLKISRRLVDSPLRRGRETQADGWDGFRAAAYLDHHFAELALEPRILTFVTQVLGPNLHLMSSQLVRLRPEKGARTTRIPEKPGWHRDIHGMARDLGSDVPRCAIKGLIWLTDTHLPKHGGTMFAPGSHRLLESLAIPPGKADPIGAASPLTRAGDVVFFENRTWHAGGRNTSAIDRWCLILQYGYRWLARVDPLRPSRPLLKKLGPIARQLMAARDTTTDGRYVAGSGSQPLGAWVKEHRIKPWHAGSSQRG